MNTQVSVPQALLKRDFDLAQKAREVFRFEQLLKNMEKMGMSFGMFIRRFTRESPKAVFAWINSGPALLAATISDQVSNFSHKSLEAIKAVGNYVSQQIYTPSHLNANIQYQFANNASPQVAAAAAMTVAYQLDDVARVADGSFIGPLRPEMASLKNAFDLGLVNQKAFKTEALFLRGISFSQDHDEYAIHKHVLDCLTNTFDGGQTCTPVLFFKEAAGQAITQFVPEGPKPTYQPAFAYA